MNSQKMNSVSNKFSNTFKKPILSNSSSSTLDIKNSSNNMSFTSNIILILIFILIVLIVLYLLYNVMNYDLNKRYNNLASYYKTNKNNLCPAGCKDGRCEYKGICLNPFPPNPKCCALDIQCKNCGDKVVKDNKIRIDRSKLDSKLDNKEVDRSKLNEEQDRLFREYNEKIRIQNEMIDKINKKIIEQNKGIFKY